MNTTNIVEKVSEKTGVARKDVAAVVNEVVATITESLKGGTDVRIRDLGTFSVTSTKAKKGRNPRTGEVLQIPAGKKAKFTASQNVKDAVG